VSIPVSLFPATRPGGVRLRMLDQDGTPLARRYFCPKDGKELDDADLVRGYAVSKERYVVVTDEELERLAPEKSRDIDLREFVPAAQVDPIYFEHPYFLVPDEASNKAYRLLVEIMERTKRAGIATFVMRGKEYLVAILAENGLLRAETMRFADEVRKPEDVGLRGNGKVARRDVTRFERALEKRAARKLDFDELKDRWVEQVDALVRKKQKGKKDVVEVEEAPEEGERPVDLVRMLAQSLGGKRRGPSPARRTGAGRGRKTGIKRATGRSARAKASGGRRASRRGG
jgi:DNA end-binding protein Ku